MQPMATSVCWVANERARTRRPISPLYRPMAVSITLAVAGGRLPLQPTVFCDRRYVLVSLIRWPCITIAFHRRRTRWNDNVRGCAVLQDRLIGWLAIIGSVGCELVNLAVDLAEQRLHLGRIIRALIGQPMGNDLATIGIHCQMEFAPVAA